MRRIVQMLAVVCLTAPLFATTVIPRSVEQLAAASSNVVVGRAVRNWSQWNAQQGVIFTYTEFEVKRSLKGSAPAKVTIRQLGGSARGITQKIAGVRQLQVGEDAVLFLRPSEERDGSMVVSSLMQGHFHISKRADGEDVVSNGVAGASQLSAQGTFSEYKGSRMTLRQLEERVRKVAAR